MNPRSHLRLVYEANPLSFIAEQVAFYLSILCSRPSALKSTRLLREKALKAAFVMRLPYMCGLDTASSLHTSRVCMQLQYSKTLHV